ncbi:MAG: transcriptional repressor [Phycisphaeraceae bacterium]|nr:transcriptional repressor [Phycisphaeraceae bacterium]
MPGGEVDDNTGYSRAPAMRIIEPLCAVFRRKLKSVGLKYTPERAQILDAIIQWEGVFQAEELLESMKRAEFRVSKATIYRTIKLLAEAGIIQQVLFDAEHAHYHLAYGKSATGLLVNVDTREITAIEVPEIAAIRDRICRENGVVPEGHRLVVYAKSQPARG